jgi:hypothetical protein
MMTSEQKRQLEELKRLEAEEQAEIAKAEALAWDGALVEHYGLHANEVAEAIKLEQKVKKAYGLKVVNLGYWSTMMTSEKMVNNWATHEARRKQEREQAEANTNAPQQSGGNV